MKISKKVLSTVLSLMVIFGAFAATQVVSYAAAEGPCKSSYNELLAPDKINKTIITGAKYSANLSWSYISLNPKNSGTGKNKCTVNKINAWVVKGTNGSAVSKKIVVKPGNTKELNYDKPVKAGDKISIRIEQEWMFGFLRAVGHANLN